MHRKLLNQGFTLVTVAAFLASATGLAGLAHGDHSQPSTCCNDHHSAGRSAHSDSPDRSDLPGGAKHSDGDSHCAICHGLHMVAAGAPVACAVAVLAAPLAVQVIHSLPQNLRAIESLYPPTSPRPPPGSCC